MLSIILEYKWVYVGVLTQWIKYLCVCSSFPAAAVIDEELCVCSRNRAQPIWLICKYSSFCCLSKSLLEHNTWITLAGYRQGGSKGCGESWNKKQVEKRRMRREVGRNCGNWWNGWSSEVLVGKQRKEWGCRALIIRAATLGPQALLDHSQNHIAANTEDRLPLSPSVILWL